eukprot:sb/3466843/
MSLNRGPTVPTVNCLSLLPGAAPTMVPPIYHIFFQGQVLKLMGWLIGVMAVVANAVVIAKHLMGLVKSKTQVAFTNKALVTLIAVGDFLIGVYLLVISAFDSIFYRTGYYEAKTVWLTGLSCTSLGVLSTLGSQLSLFAMTTLSLERVSGITRQNMCALPMNKKTFVKGQVLKLMGWLIGVMAVVANAVVIAKHLMGLVKSKTQVAFTNKALVTLIAVGDFLIGVYLLVISAFDSIFYRTGYYEAKTVWLTGLSCTSLGVLSTLGSQLSLFAMTTLSLERVSGITRQNMCALPMNKKTFVKRSLRSRFPAWEYWLSLGAF